MDTLLMSLSFMDCKWVSHKVIRFTQIYLIKEWPLEKLLEKNVQNISQHI
jgi:hypothetical protein